MLDSSHYGHHTLNQRSFRRYRDGAVRFGRLNNGRIKVRELLRGFSPKERVTRSGVPEQLDHEVSLPVPLRLIDMKRYGEKEVIAPETFRKLIGIN